MKIPDRAARGRGLWTHRGTQRPPFAEDPGPGQESVWDYPRPPVLVPDERVVEVRSGETIIARTTRAIRILETASAPTFYIPSGDVDRTLLVEAPGSSRCEWKGTARYWSVQLPDLLLEAVAWSYPDPFPEAATIRDFVAFYPNALHCTVDGERARPQAGGFYGGWITPDVVGPFKGDPGTGGW